MRGAGFIISGLDIFLYSILPCCINIITNWSQYNQALNNRSLITLWLLPKIIKTYYPKNHKQKLQGGQFRYSDVTIETVLRVKREHSKPVTKLDIALSLAVRLSGNAAKLFSFVA